jgi:NADH-quinone oxidoreductase subunit J
VEAVAFFAGAIGALGGAIAVIALRNPFYSVLALVVHLVSLAGLFLILHAEFVAAAQVVVYAGAVMVLYVFVAAYVGGVQEPAWEPIPGQQFLAPLLGVALFVELSIAVLGSSLKALDTQGPTIPLDFGSPGGIGRILLERFLIAFEAASMLLLLAAVGAVVLAGRRRTPGNERGGGAPSERFAHESPRGSTAGSAASGRVASEEAGAPAPSTPTEGGAAGPGTAPPTPERAY